MSRPQTNSADFLSSSDIHKYRLVSNVLNATIHPHGDHETAIDVHCIILVGVHHLGQKHLICSLDEHTPTVTMTEWYSDNTLNLRE